MPPIPLLRRPGYRTRREIEAEAYALRALRGDFGHVAEVSDPGLRAERALLAAHD